MGLTFSLRYSSAGGYFMSGGPLKRAWSDKHWIRWVKSQTTETQPWYEDWAKEAREHPDTEVVRELK